jgi:hypothetical protein
MKPPWKILNSLVVTSLIVVAQPSNADMFGGDGVPRMARV